MPSLEAKSRNEWAGVGEYSRLGNPNNAVTHGNLRQVSNSYYVFALPGDCGTSRNRHGVRSRWKLLASARDSLRPRHLS